MTVVHTIHSLVDIRNVPYLGVLLTPIALALGWPAAAIFLSGFSLLVTMFCLGGLVSLAMVLLHCGGVYLAAQNLMTAPV